MKMYGSHFFLGMHTYVLLSNVAMFNFNLPISTLLAPTFSTHLPNGVPYSFYSLLTKLARATWYNLNNKQYMNITGGDTANNVRNQYAANVRAMGTYTIRWEHPSPSSVSVALNGATNGAWAVIAIPYPAGTNFTLTTGYQYVFFIVSFFIC